jgi:putative DNA primase/helicase
MTGTPSNSFQPEAIPAELKDLRQWVVWDLEDRQGKTTKVPYCAKNGDLAKTDDPETWTNFEDAVTRMPKGFSGVGFVFTSVDPYVGVDLDHCIDVQTGQIAPWAKRIVDSLDSYTEVSQSGNGIHIILKGHLPGTKRKKTLEGGGAIEMYDKGRYFVMTGNRLEGTPDTINDRATELEELHVKTFGETESPVGKAKRPPTVKEKQNPQPKMLQFVPARREPPGTDDDEVLLEKARNAQNGAKFVALFDQGDLSEYDNDDSRADLALCALLAFWTGNDPTRIDSLFRQSKLYRSKWDEPRPGGTYGSQTISRALTNVKSENEDEPPTADKGPKNSLRTWQEIINAPGDDFEYVVEGMIEEGGTTLLIARQKAGKSMLVGQMSIDISFGEPFLGKLTTKKGKVLYLDFENRPKLLKKRGQDLGQGRELTDVYFAAWDRISERDLGLDGENLTRLKQTISELKPVLLVIDPLRLATKTDTNDAQKVVQLLESSAELQALNPEMGILIVHHVKKNQQLDPAKTIKLRDDPHEWIDKVHGSQALLAHVDIIVGFEQDGDDLFTLATVPRSYSPLTYALEKAPGSQRFVIAGNGAQMRTWSKTQKENWEKLPLDFSRSEGDELMNHSTLDRLIKKTMDLGMLEQDKLTKRYKKAEIGQGQKAGTSGIIIDNKEVNNGTNSGTGRDDVGHLASPISPSESQSGPTEKVA